jgi:hypothetical protein
MNAPDARLARFGDLQFKQLAAPPVPVSLPADRRNAASRRALLDRICNEFDEMPGTALTERQATRLFGIADEICARVLVHLVKDGRLRRTADGRYRLPSAA